MYLPIPATGFKALRQGLVTDTYFEAMHVHKAKQSYGEILASEEIDEKIDNFIDGAVSLFSMSPRRPYVFQFHFLSLCCL